MKQRTGRKLLGVLLALVLVLGLVPGMSVTAKAATMNNPKSLSASEVTSCSSMDGLFSKFTGFNAVSLDDAMKLTGYPQADTLLIYNRHGDFVLYCWYDSNGYYSDGSSSLNGVNGSISAYNMSYIYYTNGYSVVNVTDVTLNPSTVQTIKVGEKVSFTASVLPNDATDKKVKWSVGGTNADAVKLYSDAECNNEIGADATDKLIVYAKGIQGLPTLFHTARGGCSSPSPHLPVAHCSRTG